MGALRKGGGVALKGEVKDRRSYLGEGTKIKGNIYHSSRPS
jgi:hypothetical protein